MHMENATSIMMGSCKKNSIQRVRLTVTFSAAVDNRKNSYTDREELPVLLYSKRSGSI